MAELSSRAADGRQYVTMTTEELRRTEGRIYRAEPSGQELKVNAAHRVRAMRANSPGGSLSHVDLRTLWDVEFHKARRSGLSDREAINEALTAVQGKRDRYSASVGPRGIPDLQHQFFAVQEEARSALNLLDSYGVDNRRDITTQENDMDSPQIADHGSSPDMPPRRFKEGGAAVSGLGQNPQTAFSPPPQAAEARPGVSETNFVTITSQNGESFRLGRELRLPNGQTVPSEKFLTDLLFLALAEPARGGVPNDILQQSGLVLKDVDGKVMAKFTAPSREQVLKDLKASALASSVSFDDGGDDA